MMMRTHLEPFKIEADEDEDDLPEDKIFLLAMEGFKRSTGLGRTEVDGESEVAVMNLLWWPNTQVIISAFLCQNAKDFFVNPVVRYIELMT